MLKFAVSTGIGAALGYLLGSKRGDDADTKEKVSGEKDSERIAEVEFLSPTEIDARKRTRKDISWPTVAFGVNFMIKDIIRARFEPEIIAGIGRGGGIVACLVAGNLGNKPVAIIDRKLQYHGGKMSSELNEIPSVVLNAKKVLLVMGGPSSGRVLLEVAQRVSAGIGNRAEIRTVNLFEKLPVKYSADFKYKSFKVETRPPWQIREEYKAFDSSE